MAKVECHRLRVGVDVDKARSAIKDTRKVAIGQEPINTVIPSLFALRSHRHVCLRLDDRF